MERNEAERNLIGLWFLYSERYRTLVIEYRFLYAYKREKKWREPRRVNETVIRELPEIPLFNILSSEQLVFEIEQMKFSELIFWIKNIQRIVSTDKPWRELNSFVISVRNAIKREQAGKYKCIYALDPQYYRQSKNSVEISRKPTREA